MSSLKEGRHVPDLVSPALADVAVTDDDGRPSRLGELWVARPAVLVWVRHFG